MTELRQRMIECLQLRGLAERTQEAYVRAVRQLSEHDHKATAINPTRANKSDSAKDAQIVRFKERVNALEERVRSLQEENELLYGKLSNLRG